jgi:hypothetical protein
MGKCSNAFFSETTNMIKAKLYMNVHWMVLYKLFPIGSNVDLCIAVAAILDFRSRSEAYSGGFQCRFLGRSVSFVQVVSEKKRFEPFFP